MTIPGITLNVDESDFLVARSAADMNEAGFDALVDAHADTQVREIIFCISSQRSYITSKVKQTSWDGFDPNRGNDQPFFADTPPAEVEKWFRRWFDNIALFRQRGIDPFARWINRSRQHGISPWLGVRMNDVHGTNHVDYICHDRFWKEHPEFWRVTWRLEHLADRALDYGRPEVRAYQMAHLREVIDAYDMDGLELDWMRHPFHFRPGFEEQGGVLLTEFMAEVRQHLTQRAKQLGHPIRLGVRVPARPETARRLGLDAVTWARRGLVDVVVVTPQWETTDFDMPIELWKQLLQGTNASLGAGIEVNLCPHPAGRQQPHTLETVRGTAATLLDRGADRIYFFNFLDCSTVIKNQIAEKQLLREVGSLETLAGKCRRHVLTFTDTTPPGDPITGALPRPCQAAPSSMFGVRRTAEFRVPTGPAPQPGLSTQVRFGFDPADTPIARELRVRVNGELCSFAAVIQEHSEGLGPTHAYDVPSGVLHRGDNLIEVCNPTDDKLTIVWVEVAIGDAKQS